MRRSAKLYKTFIYVCLFVGLLVILYTRRTRNIEEELNAQLDPKRNGIYQGPGRHNGVIPPGKRILSHGPVVDHGNDMDISAIESVVSSTGPDCPGLTRPSVPKTDTWQTSAGNVKVFSAFLDGRKTKYGEVRIVGTQMREQGNVSLWCHLWTGNQLRVVKANRVWLPEVSVNRYAAIIINCQLFASYQPDVVSLTANEHACVEGSSALAVHNLWRRTQHVHDFTVCLSDVITDQFHDVTRLVEWVEVQEAFGADHVIVYRQGLVGSPDTLRTLTNHYVDQRKLLTVVNWPFPFDAAMGEMALLSDCLYRTMYTSAHATFLHLNEFIVPRGNTSYSWYDVLQPRDCHSQYEVLIQKAIFDAGATDDVTSGASDLLTVSKTSRNKRILPYQEGARYMIIPEQVRIPGPYRVHRFLKETARSQTCYMSPKEALVHSYQMTANKKPMKNAVIDRAFHKFRHVIAAKVEQVYDQM